MLNWRQIAAFIGGTLLAILSAAALMNARLQAYDHRHTAAIDYNRQQIERVRLGLTRVVCLKHPDLCDRLHELELQE